MCQDRLKKGIFIIHDRGKKREDSKGKIKEKDPEVLQGHATGSKQVL